MSLPKDCKSGLDMVNSLDPSIDEISFFLAYNKIYSPNLVNKCEITGSLSSLFKTGSVLDDISTRLTHINGDEKDRLKL